MQNALKTYIIDDEILAIENLKTILYKNFPFVLLVGTAQSIDKAVTEIPTLNIDILFLDIELKNSDGFEIFEKLSKINFRIIFVTAFSEYAIKAFKFYALDYILKPLNLSELKVALDKALMQNTDKYEIERFYDSIMKSKSSENSFTNKLILKHQNGIEVLKFSEIVFIQADASYCIFHCLNDKKITYSKNSSEVEKILPSSLFIRIHKSYIVNRIFINEKKIGNKNIILTTGTSLPVARRRYDDLISFFRL